MLELDHICHGFRTKTFYLCDAPFDVENVDSVQFRYLRNKSNAEGFDCYEDRTIILDLSRGEEAVWRNMAGKCRSDIRKAENIQIDLKRNSNCEAFVELMDRFRASKELDPLPEPQELIARIRSPLPDYFALFTAEHVGELLGGVLFIKDEKQMIGIIAASNRLEVDKERRNLIACVNRLLWWEAIRYGVREGLDVLDMGGYFKGTLQCKKDPTLEGVSEFKRRFGGEIVPRYEYKKDYTYRMKMARYLAKTYRAIRSLPMSRPAPNELNTI